MGKSIKKVFLDFNIIRKEDLPKNAKLIGTNRAFTYKTKTGKKKVIFEYFYTLDTWRETIQ